MKRHTHKLTRILGVFAGFSLAATPLVASATTNTKSAELNVNINEVLTVSLSLPDNWASGDAGQLLRNAVRLDVASNNGNGFTATMNTKTSNTALTNKNANSSDTIPTLASSTTKANFPANYWGYSLNDTTAGDNSSTYGAIAGFGSSVSVLSSNSAASATQDIYFAAKIDATKDFGTYSNTVVFNVVSGITTPLTISDLTYMQDFANLSDTNKVSVIASMTPDTAYTLRDNRDNQIYNIAKLADGKIWLLDNLALDLTNSTVLNNLTASNTNASATSLTSLRSGNRSAGDQYATAGVSNWTSGSSYSAPLVNMTNKDVVPDNAPTNSKGNNKVGGYYNYCAASAGSYCYGDGTGYGTSSGNATEDICPAGWRLPTGSATGEYPVLANQIYGSTGSTSDATAIANYRNALSLPLSGRFNSGSANFQGDKGTFWSSTRYDNRNMYYLYVDTDEVNPVDYNIRNYGFSVRCLVQ